MSRVVVDRCTSILEEHGQPAPRIAGVAFANTTHFALEDVNQALADLASHKISERTTFTAPANLVVNGRLGGVALK